MSTTSAFKAVVICVFLVLAGIPVLFPDASAEAWTKNDMGKPYDGNTYYGLYGVAVGDGDRDSSNEVYVTSFDDATVYQYTFTDAGWVSTDIASGGTYLYRVIVGDGDDDGSSEVYAAGYSYTWPNYGPMLQQVYHDDSGWHSNLITTLGYWTVNVAMGDGNNDNRTEIYTSDYYGHLYQNAKGKTWDSQDLGNTTNSSDSSYASMYGLAIGDGDNDGKSEVYGSSSIGYVDRFAYDGSSWKRTIVGRGELNSYYGENYSMIFAIKVGDADNDGQNEVYGVSWTNASVYRFAWDNSSKSWVRTTIASLGNWIYAYSLAIGDADGDGNNEIYAGTYKQVYKVWYDGTNKEWRSTGVGGGNSYMYDLAIGSATGDTGQKELYSACLDGHAYQFYTDRAPPANPVVSSDTHPVPGTWYNRSVVHVMWKDAGYDISGIDGYSVSWDKNSKTVPDDTKEFEEKTHDAKSPPLADGNNWYFHIRSRDNAVNWNATAAHFGPICIDTVAPDSLSLLINGGAEHTGDRKVTLSINATDPKPSSGLLSMSFSNDGNSWSPYEKFSDQRFEWDLTEPRYGGNDSDGLKYVYVKVIDGAGNEIKKDKWARAWVYLDRVGPFGLSLLINGGEEYTTVATVTLELVGQDAASGIAKMAFSNDGVEWSGWLDWENSTGWSLTEGAGGSDTDGNKSVLFRAADRAGNIGGPVKDSIILDRAPPEGLSITINNGEEYATCATVELALTGADHYTGSGLTEMCLANDPGSLGSWEAFAQHKSGWDLTGGAGGTDIDGNKTVLLKCRDRAGNEGGPVTDTIFLDRARPDPVSISINGGATYATSADVTLSLSASDPAPGSGVYAMQLSDDGTRWSDWEAFAGSKSYTLPGGDGAKTVHFRVKDRAGNLGPEAQSSIILDTRSPVISNVRVVGITDSSAMVVWTTGEESDSAVEYGETSAYGSSAREAAYLTAHSVSLKGLKASTTYHFRVRSADRAGNPPAFSEDLVFITAATPDTSPPMISNVQVQGITDRLAVVSWTTSEPADSTVQYGPTSAYGQRASEAGYVLMHSVVLRDLAASTTYHFRVESKDTSGNGPAVSPDGSFTTLASPDTAAPVISNVRVAGITSRLAVVSWETDEPADSTVEYGNTTSYGMAATDRGLLALHELTITDLEPLTTYHFRVLSTDASGNGPSASMDLTFTTAALPDILPPAISNVRAEQVTESTAMIIWETDELADGLVEFGITTNFGTTSSSQAYALQHSLLLQGLKPDTPYHLRVRSADPSGNLATGADWSFRTKATGAGPDRTAPAISGVFVTGITDTRAVVLWQTDELANGELEYGTTMGYGLRATDPVYITSHTIVLNGLKPSTEYHLRVKSTDAFGNGPSASADFRFQTTSGPDRAGPVISEIIVQNITNTSASISWRTNEPATSIVDYGADTFYGRNLTSRVFVLNHTILLTGLSPGVDYHFAVRSVDPTGNPSNASADRSFTTLKNGGEPPVVPPNPKPTNPFLSTDNPWPWIGLAIAIAGVAGAAYAGYARRRRRDVAAEPADAGEMPVPLPRAEPTAPASSTTVPHEVPHVARAQAPSGPAPVPAATTATTQRTPSPPSKPGVASAETAAGRDDVETVEMGAAAPEPVEMESGSSGAAAAALARSRRSPSTPASTTPLKHIRCPSCKTRIPIFKEGPQMVQCPGCGKKGPYKPKG